MSRLGVSGRRATVMGNAFSAASFFLRISKPGPSSCRLPGGSGMIAFFNMPPLM